MHEICAFAMPHPMSVALPDCMTQAAQPLMHLTNLNPHLEAVMEASGRSLALFHAVGLSYRFEMDPVPWRQGSVKSYVEGSGPDFQSCSMSCCFGAVKSLHCRSALLDHKLYPCNKLYSL